MDLIQELRHFLEQFQLDFPKLFAAFAICFVVFIFSARELACWFFKIQGIKKDQKKLATKLDELEQLIRGLQVVPLPALQQTEPIQTLSTQKKSATLQFPLQKGMSASNATTVTNSPQQAPNALPTEEWMNRPLT